MTRVGSIWFLAWRDLMKDRFFLVCNIAVQVGILVPLMVMFGVKNGVTNALFSELLANPNVLQVDTIGNTSFSPEDFAALNEWPEVAFWAPRVRSAFDDVNVKRIGGRSLISVKLTPTGPGDPNLPADLPAPTGKLIFLSESAAARLDAKQGDRLEVFGQIQPGDRPGNLLIEVEVLGVIPASRIAGHALLAEFEIVDAFEALYEGYEVPQFGLTQGAPLDTRVVAYEGLRAYAKDITQVVGLETKLGAHLDVGTRGSAAEIEALSRFSRNLELVLVITATLAALGLFAALVTGAFANVMRKKISLATLSMLGVSPRKLAFVPLLQGMITAIFGLMIAFPLFWLGATVLSALFQDALPGDGALAVLTIREGLGISMAVLVLTTLSMVLAARQAMRLDPAAVLREGT
ncbi:MAG: FtsX-like permease family protein [Pseudomonadota bacterium]